jgi:hypothetical protein
MRTWKVRLLALTSAVAMLLAVSAPVAMADDFNRFNDRNPRNNVFNNEGFFVGNFDDDNDCDHRGDCDFDDCDHRGDCDFGHFGRNFFANDFFDFNDRFDDNDENDIDFRHVGDCIAVVEQDENGEDLDVLLCPRVDIFGNVVWDRVLT